jgi:DNA-binding MarR family transcriptional regulator
MNANQRGHELAMHLRAAHAHLRRRSNLAFAPFGMTADQYVLLTVLAQDGEATQQELVRRCYSDTATIGTMVSLLEKKGLVTRTPHPEDGRAISVKLTRSGRRLAEEMRRSSTGIRTELTALFNEQELRTLMEFLDRLAGAMRPPGRKTAAARARRLKLKQGTR